MLTDAAVFQRQEIISPLSSGLDKTIFQLTVNFVFVPAIPTIHSFLFFYFTANNAVRDEANPQTTMHSCTPGSKVFLRRNTDKICTGFL